MCGIAGFYTPEPSRDAMEVLRGMNDTIAHRGPDAQGHWFDPAHGVALAHRRLAIVDLTEEGRQPMRSASGRYIIVFNGEIYNFLRIRTDLERLGHRFRGHSDTEVMLAACLRSLCGTQHRKSSRWCATDSEKSLCITP
jgi:asparagine synthase (glutamine-hydrolysing)